MTNRHTKEELSKVSLQGLKALGKGYGLAVSKYKATSRGELEDLIIDQQGILMGETPATATTEPKDVTPKEEAPKNKLAGAKDKADKKKADTKAKKNAKTSKGDEALEGELMDTTPSKTAVVIHTYGEVQAGKVSLEEMAITCKSEALTDEQRLEIIEKMNSGIGARAILTGFLLISTGLKGGELHELAEDKFNIKKTQCNVYVRVAKKLGDRLEEVKDMGINELIELCKNPKGDGEGEEDTKKVKSSTILKALENLSEKTALDIEISSEDTPEAFLKYAKELMEEITQNIERSLNS